MSGLLLHCGAEKVGYGEVINTKTPRATSTWTPIAHEQVIDGIKQQLETRGIETLSEEHSLSHGGDRYFGLMQIARKGRQDVVSNSDYGLTIGIRNSHDKTFPVGLAVGSRVFVCDNLSFSGEINVVRKHTRWVRRDLPALMCNAVAQITAKAKSQHERFQAYKMQELKDAMAHHLIIQMLRAQAITSSQVEKIVNEWYEPSHEDFNERNVWSLFNAVTEVAKGKANPHTMLKRSQRLHGVCDLAAGIAL